MTPRQDDSLALSLLRVIRRRLKLVLACLVLTPAVALAYSLTAEEQYEATASLLFRDPGFDQLLFGSTFFDPARDPRRQAATNATLVSLDGIAQRTARRLDGITRKQVSEAIDVEARVDADVVDVTATDPSPRFARDLANVFASEYIAFRREADRDKIADAQRVLETQRDASAVGADAERQRALDRQLDQLEFLASLQTGNAELVQPALSPRLPASPRPRRNTALGAALGLVLGLGLALLFDRLDRRLRDPAEVGEIFERPILGVIPESRGVARSTTSDGLPGPDAEAFRMLRASLLYFNVDGDVRSVLVTSATPGDGKSTVAWHLAATAASLGSRTLLIEADLRNPSLGRFEPELARRPGLSALLAHQARPSEVTHEVAVPRPGRNGSGADAATLDVIFAGDKPPNPTDLIESDGMAQLLVDSQLAYDLVVVDTPPTSVVSDAIPLVNAVSGVIVVTRLGKNTRDVATTLRDQLRNLNAPIFGVVVNGFSDESVGTYGYGYTGHYG